ncbi:hypothetical protein D3C71_2227760 [compost metagenome]
MQDADTGARAHRLGLTGGAGYFKGGVPVAHDLAGIVQRRREDQILDVADAPMALECFHIRRRSIFGEIGL